MKKHKNYNGIEFYSLPRGVTNIGEFIGGNKKTYWTDIWIHIAFIVLIIGVFLIIYNSECKEYPGLYLTIEIICIIFLGSCLNFIYVFLKKGEKRYYCYFKEGIVVCDKKRGASPVNMVYRFSDTPLLIYRYRKITKEKNQYNETRVKSDILYFDIAVKNGKNKLSIFKANNPKLFNVLIDQIFKYRIKELLDYYRLHGRIDFLTDGYTRISIDNGALTINGSCFTDNIGFRVFQGDIIIESQRVKETLHMNSLYDAYEFLYFLENICNACKIENQ